MPVRFGFLSTAHMHCWGYANGMKHNPRAELVGVWDPDRARGEKFAESFGIRVFDTPDEVCEAVDAVAITAENKRHAEYGAIAARHGKHMICEKPLVTSKEEWELLSGAASRAGVKIMTAFPCRYSPAFLRLVQRVKAGDIGKINAICATNRGSCPFGWFTETEKSGGGSLIDHVVHVADLLWVLLDEAPVKVQAQVGNNMYGQSWEDTAMLTLEYADGKFVTLDSSWSRPKSYKTWGDVTMNVVGEQGVIELDMFNQAVDVFTNTDMRHGLAGYGSDLDAGLVDDFLNCIENDTPPAISGEDGWRAVQVALAGYESVRRGGEAVAVE